MARHKPPQLPRAFTLPILLLLTAACGKVGDPLPPLILIPEAVQDLSAAQRSYDVVLSWTNPARNIDGSAARDLAMVHILSGGVLFDAIDVSQAGALQTYSIAAQTLIGADLDFTVRIQTTHDRLSGFSNTVSITPVDVPGPVVGLTAVVDQRRIALEWEPPRQNAQWADVYIVTRGDRGEAATVTVPRFEDPGYVPGQTYTYQVTAARNVDGRLVPALTAPPLEVAAVDTVPPRVPEGLRAVADGFLTWEANPEADLLGYRLYRSESADGPFIAVTERPHPTNAFFDPGYRSGFHYAVSATDESGNESALSGPYRAP